MKKTHTPEFKAKLVLNVLKEEKTLSQIATEYIINPTMLSKWRGEVIAGRPSIFRKEISEARLRAAYEQKKRNCIHKLGV
ncbi:MAG: transposase [Clostridiales bacterium]|nr:transposase [Clostridiales bacterium]